ncbi:unnamed protein product [Plutella xylostella]|uniref:(diamondback moth) hypothetical protein n=1 Tax=Plutella xylostella TaxID=51655 RepID=A0A8S4G608_PLUXY|nr:unnamed protein product [Plutella xylostella]
MGWVVGALVVAWYLLSAASNVVGKLLLQELPRPLTATLAQLAAAAALSALWERRAAPPGYTRALLPLAGAKLGAMLLSQVAIWRMPVSYAHTVKATTPLWTALLQWAVWGVAAPRRVLGALALIAAGVALASLTELGADAGGLAAALGAAALLAAQHLYSKRALTAAPRPLQLLRALSVLAGAALLPPWLLADAPALLAGEWSARAAGLLAADALLAWLQALAALGVLARVSPLAYGVASAAKRVAVVAASLLLLRNPAPPLNVAGMALAAAGVLLYNRAKAAPAAARPLLPV